MPAAYQLLFTAPDSSANLPALRAGCTYTLDATRGKPPTSRNDALTAASVLGSDLFVAEISVGPNERATVFIGPGNWPNACERFCKLELGATTEFAALWQSVNPGLYSRVAGPTDYRLLVIYDSLGFLTIKGVATTLRYDLAATNATAERQQFQISVLPEAGATATISIDGNDTAVSGT